MEKIINEIMNLKIGDVLVNASLSKYTTYKVGGIAKVLVYPKNTEKLIELMQLLRKNQIKHFILGNGSNVLFSDNTYDGVIIKLDNFNEIEFNETTIKVGAGYSLIKLAMEAVKHDLAGLEFASGIPGTVGGAIFMNAGAYNSNMAHVVSSVDILTDELKVITLSNEEMKFAYRESILQHKKDYICLGATLKLECGIREELELIMKDRKLQRKRTQPLEFPSAGSVFRNPTGMFAGKIIEDLNLKGYQVGGAKISEKHANFIINTGNATASDIKQIIDLVKTKVKEKYNIKLRVEQRLVNWDKKNEK